MSERTYDPREQERTDVSDWPTEKLVDALLNRIPADLWEIRREAARRLRRGGAGRINFSCPHCGSPNAEPSPGEPIDIHSGATYECGECGGEVIFSAETPEQYTERLRDAPSEGRRHERPAGEDPYWVSALARCIDKLEYNVGLIEEIEPSIKHRLESVVGNLEGVLNRLREERPGGSGDDEPFWRRSDNDVADALMEISAWIADLAGKDGTGVAPPDAYDANVKIEVAADRLRRSTPDPLAEAVSEDIARCLFNADLLDIRLNDPGPTHWSDVSERDKRRIVGAVSGAWHEDVTDHPAPDEEADGE